MSEVTMSDAAVALRDLALAQGADLPVGGRAQLQPLAERLRIEAARLLAAGGQSAGGLPVHGEPSLKTT